LVALLSVLTLCLGATVASAAASYVPPIVTTATTTLFSNGSTNIAPGRVAVDKAGNTFYMVNGGTTSTLMEIPAFVPAVTDTAPLTLITGLGQYNANVAFVDVNGNLWVSTGNGTATTSSGTDYISLVEVPASGGIPNTAALTAGGESVSAIDTANGHCSATSTLPCVWQNYKFNTTTSPGTQVNGPQISDLYIDGSGNLYYVDVYDNNETSNSRVVKVNIFTGAGTGTVLADMLPHDYNSQVAVDGAGNVYYMDSGTGVVSLVSGGALTAVGNTAALTSAEIGTATGISSDAWGNLYINSKTQLSEVPFEAGSPSALNFVDEFGIVSGLTNNIIWGGSVDAWGNYYYASYTNIMQVQVGGYNFGSVPVSSIVNASSTVKAPTLTVYFNAPETVSGNFFPTGSPTTNTVAAALQSFPYSGTKSIGGGSSWTAGQTGTIIMDFEPVHPGLLKGSYTPRNGSSAIETTVNLQGVGVGPQPLLAPGVASSLFTSAATSISNSTQVNLNGPTGIAVDTFGDVFVTDSGNAKVVAYCLTTTITATTGNSFCSGNSGYAGAPIELGPGFTNPAGIALDGANSLYVVDSAANKVTVIQGDNLSSSTLVAATSTFGGTALNGPKGIALDGYANIYIADTGNNRIVKAHQFGATVTDNLVLVPSTTKFGGTALSGPTGIALDVAGDLFIADTGNNRIVEFTPLGAASVVATTGVTLNAPTGVVVSPSGSLFVTDTTNDVSLIGGGTGMTISFGSFTLSTPQGIALDLDGNVYVSDTLNDRVLELNLSSPTTAASFPSTPDGATSASDDQMSVYNGGNATLAFSALALDAGDTNFGILGTSTCAATATVTEGTPCNLVTDFTPGATATLGTLTGTVTLTDNLLSYTLVTSTSNETAAFGASGTQTIGLSGTAIGTQTINFTPPATPVVYGVAPIALVATGGASGNPVLFAVDSGSTGSGFTTGNMLTITGAGTVVIDATQAGNASYAAAAQVQQSIIVTQASQTITFAPTVTSYPFSAGSFSLSATATSNLAVSFASTTSSVCTVSGTTATILSAGTCTIQAMQAGNSNYAVAALVPVNFTITQGAQTITFAPTVTSYPASAGSFGLSATATSNLAVSFASTTSGVCTVSGTTATILSSGTCTIQATQAGNSNYTAATPVSVDYTIASNSQTITFAPTVTSYPFSTGSFSLSATATSSLAVSFTSTTSAVCTVSSTTATIVSTGTCTIQATQAGNSSYAAATPVAVNFTITQAPQTITFAPTVTSYPYLPAGTFSLSATSTSSLAVGFASTTSGVCTVSGTTATILSAGTCTIQATQAGNANYTAATPVPVNFTITKAAQTITFAPTVTSYPYSPTEAFSLSGTASSSLAVSFTSTTSGVCTVSGTTATIVSVGTCTIQATQAGNSNYAAATPVPVNFTITKATQTITFAPTVTSYPYSPTGTFSLSSTTSASLAVAFASTTDSVCTVSGTTTTILSAGACTIQATQAGNGNYAAASPVSVNFTITPASQTITFAPTVTSYPYSSTGTFSLSSTASSNLAVAFVSTTSGVCTVSGATATILSAGTCTIQATQAGNSSYAAATPVSVNFTITAVPQAITISASPASPTYPATSAITATGGGSGNPVTLAITSGATIATLSGTTLTPTGTAFGAVVVTANQAGNTNYAAAAPATVTVTFAAAATVATPTISPASGTVYVGSTDSITIADATANAVIWYTTDGSNPLTSTTHTKYTAAFTLAASTTPYTVMAAATLTGDTPSAAATATYTASAVPPSFALTANPPAVTVTPGQSAAVTIYLTPGTGFALTTTFACSGVPSGVTCSFSPSSVTPTGTAAVSTVLTISNGTAALQHGPNPFLPGGVTFAIALGFLGWKKRRGLFLALVLVAGVICLTQVTGCGSSAKPSTTSTMTVTATSSAVTETLPIAVTVVQ